MYIYKGETVFTSNPYTVLAENGEEYTVIGYEDRGIYRVPVVEECHGEYIQTDVFEMVHNMKTLGGYYGLCRPNMTELALLEEAGWIYDGCWASRKE